jgi:phage terminase small subunit
MSRKTLSKILNDTGVKPNEKMRMNERLQQPVPPLEEQGKTVSPQQWKFIYELIDGEGRLTMKQAAINAGYPEKNANKTASDLTNPKKYPHVVAAIQKYRQQMAEKYGTNIERHLRDLQIIRDQALEAGNFGAAVTAEYRRGQALGTIYIDRKEIRHGTIDSMSADEVRRKLEEIKALYGGPPPNQIIDVTPEEIEQAEGIDLIEEIRDGEKARKRAAQEAKRQPAELSDNATGEPSRSGDAGLPSGSDQSEIRDDRAEGGGAGEEGETEPSSDIVQPEARNDRDASLDTGPASPEGDHEEERDQAAAVSREAGSGAVRAGDGPAASGELGA